jgi:hypothetical protein
VVAVILMTVLVATVCDMGGWFKARPDKHESCVHTITEGNSHIVGLSDRTRKKNLVYFNYLSILYSSHYSYNRKQMLLFQHFNL